MPLAHVLDVETGIGYIQNLGSGDVNPLVDDLILPQKENTLKENDLKLNKVHRFLMDQIIAATKEKKRNIQLKDSDFEELPLA